MKFLHLKKVFVALEDVPKKPSVFIDRMTWFICGVAVGFIITYLIIK